MLAHLNILYCMAYSIKKALKKFFHIKDVQTFSLNKEQKLFYF